MELGYKENNILLKANDSIFPLTFLTLIYFWYNYSELQKKDIETKHYNKNLENIKDIKNKIERYKKENISGISKLYKKKEEIDKEIGYYEKNSPVIKRENILSLITLIFIIYIIAITIYVHYNIDYSNSIILSLTVYLGYGIIFIFAGTFAGIILSN